MRTEILILFLLFVSLGLSSGFVISTTTGAIEINNASSGSPNISNENSSESNFKIISAINETELFQIVNDKTSNLSERSLIFINEKLKSLRRIPLKNRYQGYPDFMSQPAQGVNRWLTVEKVPPKFVNEASFNPSKPIQHPLFNPNMIKKKPQLPTLYRYVYPEIPKRNKSCMYEKLHHTKPQINNIITNNPDLIDEIDVKYTENRRKLTSNESTNPSKLGNHLDKSCLDMSNNNNNKASPEQHSKKVLIKSYTNRNRKPNRNKEKCGFLKPNWLHRMTFNKNTGDKITPVNVFDMGHHLDSANNDETLDKYIKEALVELQTQIKKSDDGIDKKDDMKRSQQEDENNTIDTSDQKINELIAKIGNDEYQHYRDN